MRCSSSAAAGHAAAPRATVGCGRARGIDFSPYAARARDLFGLAIENCDLDDASFAPGSFDVVVSHATFEHLANPLEVGAETVRLLRPGRLFVVSGDSHRTVSIRVFAASNSSRPAIAFSTHRRCGFAREAPAVPVAIRTYGVNVTACVDLVRRLPRAGGRLNVRHPR
jgi:SAM-dependent methyltransferase